MHNDLLFIGIDPAPSKPTVIVYGYADGEPESISLPASKVRDWLEKQTPRRLVAWDAPLSFAPRFGYSDRPVDRAVRAFVNQQIKDGKFAAGAVSALPFSGCPHWAITCNVLGRPFGRPEAYHMPATQGDLGREGPFAIEVHPTVAVALWWLADEGAAKPFTRYKPGGGLRAHDVDANRSALVPALGRWTKLPEAFFSSDDKIDASVAWFMAKEFAAGRAAWIGGPEHGGYVLPDVGSHTADLHGRVAKSIENWTPAE